MTAEGKQTDIVQESLHAIPYLFALKSDKIRGKLLDIGIGDGTPLRRALKWANIQPELVIGLDVNPALLVNFPKDMNATSIVSNGLLLPFREDTFSLVTSCQVLEHVNHNQHQKFLGELMRVVQPNGRLAIATMNQEFPYNVRGHKDHVAEFDTCRAMDFLELCQGYGEAKLYVVIPSQRYIEAQAKRAKFWILRPIKNFVPREISELALTLLTKGKVHPGLDMREDFQVKEFKDLTQGELFTDFLFEVSKEMN